MNENMPMIKPFFKHINKTRSRLVGFLLLLAATVAFVAIIALPKCDVSTQTAKVSDVLVGNVVTLKKPQEENFIDYHNMFSDTVRKDLEFPKHIDLSYTINYLRHELSRAAKGEMLMYLIFDNKDNKLIGSTEIRELNNYDPGQVGIWINENYWGGGRALEALGLITDAYFKLHPEHDSYIAHVRLWNARSLKLLKKFGFKEEGYFYEHGEPARHILRYTKQK